MSEIENLITSLQKEIDLLTVKNQELEYHIKDFERMVHAWKKAYGDMESKYRVRLANYEQTIEELEKELLDFRANKEY